MLPFDQVWSGPVVGCQTARSPGLHNETVTEDKNPLTVLSNSFDGKSLDSMMNHYSHKNL